VNFRQIDCFLAVAEGLNFSVAADKLFLSQSSVSQHVSALEKELGVTLFTRDRHHVELTEAGSYLNARYRAMREDFEAVNARARSMDCAPGQTLSLGYDGPLAEVWIGDAARIFHASHPDVRLQVKKGSALDFPAMLRNRTVDAVIVHDVEVSNTEGLTFQALATAQACVYYPAGHRFERLRYVTTEDLAGECIVSPYGRGSGQNIEVSPTGAMLQGSGIDLRGAYTVDGGDAAFLAVQAGIGVLVASHLCDGYAARYGVRSADLQSSLPLVQLGLAWMEGNPRIDAFAVCARRVLAQTQQRCEERLEVVGA
jgi:DNA-binding transcriptional LysR family regulator